jgi:alginate O-acetyltransferase complex protein AlgI
VKLTLFLLSAAFVALVSRGTWWAPLPYALLPPAWYFLQERFSEKLKSSLSFFWLVILFELSPLLLLKPIFAFQQSIGLLPLGLSFFVFQAVSFTADWRKNKIKVFPSLLDYWLFLLFFPKFLCGPLERLEHFRGEVAKATWLPRESRTLAIELILTGLAKKMLVANYLRALTAPYFDRAGPPSSLLEALAVTYAFAVEFYCDFSAYTDLAQGLALVAGISLAPNFRRPYLALNPQDFWQRWHISLSSWFRDYVHYPLFFLTKNLHVTVFSTFFLMGIWHGFGLSYLSLGVYWGLVMVGYSALQPLRVRYFSAHKEKPWFRFLSWLLTFHVVLVSFFLLRDAGSLAWSKLSFQQPLAFTPFVEQSLMRILFVLPLLTCVEMVRQENPKTSGLSLLSWEKKIGLFVLLAYYSFILFFFTEEKGLADVRFLYFQF